MLNRLMSAFGLATVLCIQSASGQTTGPTILDHIREDFSHRSEYRVRQDLGRVVISDAMSGKELFTVSSLSRNAISIEGSVARGMTPTFMRTAGDHIAHFNCSAPVGTLIVATSGDILLQHYVNPELVPAAAIVNLAQRFGDAVRTESLNLATQ